MRDPIEHMTETLLSQQERKAPPIGGDLVTVELNDIPTPKFPAEYEAVSMSEIEASADISDAVDEDGTGMLDEAVEAGSLTLDLSELPQPDIPTEFCATASDEIGETQFAFPPSDTPLSEDTEDPSARSVSEYKAAQMAEEQHSFLVWLGQLYVWRPPAYQILPENELIALLKDSFDERITVRKSVAFWKGVIAQLETNSHNFVDLSTIQQKEEEVVFRNGVYNVYTQEMRSASPEDYILTYNDIDFDPDAASEGSVTEQFFEDFSSGDSEIKNLAWAIIGAILSQGNSFKKYFLFYGASDTGKSVLGNLIESLVGERNCSHFPLNRLSGFETAQLVGKKLNCNLDLSAVEVADLGVFKMLTGGGYDTIDCQKKYGRFVTLRTNEIKMLFACNALPHVSPDEDPTSFFGRLVLLPFLNPVPADRKNTHLRDDLLREKDYIICQSMQAYRKLLQDNFVFPYCEIAHQLIDAHSRQSEAKDPLEEFVHFDCKLSPDFETNNDDLYAAYTRRCITMKRIPLAKNSFISQIRKKYSLEGGRGKRDAQNKRAHVTRGISLCANLTESSVLGFAE